MKLPAGRGIQANPGGASKPPATSASNFANSMQLRSSKYGPMICIPTGSQPGERPIGAAVAGSQASVASEIHAS